VEVIKPDVPKAVVSATKIESTSHDAPAETSQKPSTASAKPSQDATQKDTKQDNAPPQDASVINNEKCLECGKVILFEFVVNLVQTVYLTDRVSVDGKVLHKFCWRCK
jgi:hypothetical protein